MDDSLGMIVLGVLAVLCFISVVFIPLIAIVWWMCYGKEVEKKTQSDQQEARARLIAQGIVRADKW